MPATMMQKVKRTPKFGAGVAGLIRTHAPRRRGLGPQNLGRGVLLQNYRPPAATAPRPAAPTPAAPAAATAPAPAASAGPVDPRDAEFWSNFGTARQQRDNQLADIGRAGSNAITDRDSQLARLIDQRKQSLLNATHQDAQRGLFYSTTLTNDNRDVNKGYDDQESSTRQAFDRGEAERAAARRDLQLQYGTGDDLGAAGASLLRDAIQRQIDRAVAAPLPDVQLPAPKAKPKPKPKKKKGRR